MKIKEWWKSHHSFCSETGAWSRDLMIMNHALKPTELSRQHVYVSHRPIVKCGAKIRDYFILHKKLAYFFYSPIHAIHRRINRYISPIHKTDEVATKIYTQSIGCKGVTLNNAPPKLTIKICPARIMRVTHRNPLHEANRSKADRKSVV